MKLRKNSSTVPASLLFLTVSACLPAPANRGPGGNSGGGNSVLMAIEGMDQGDKRLPGISYNLHCETSAGVAKDPITGEFVPGNDETIKFAGDKIADGDVCALDIRIPPPQGAEADLYEWIGKGDKRIGLLYGSSRGKVEARKLAVELHRLYIRKTGPEFKATIDVSWELPAGGKVPADASATMTCGNNKSYPTSEYKATTETEGAYTFKLPVAEMKGVACSTLSILQNAKVTFEGTLDPAVIKFGEPKQDEVLAFPGKVKLAEKKVDSVTISTTAGKCVNYDADKLKCLDVRSITMPREKNLWAARVQVRSKPNEVITLFVGPGAVGNSIDNAKTRTVLDLTKSLAKTATPAEKAAFSWFNTSVYPGFQSAEYLKTIPADSLLHKSAAKRETIEGLEIGHIETLWIHGFKEVNEGTLNAATAARWFAHVKATSGANTAQFIVAGADDYFASAARPGGDKFFAWDGVKADRDAKTGKYKVFAIKGGAMAPPACNAELSYYLDELSVKYDDEIKPGSTRDSLLDGCLVATDKFVKDFDAWTVTPTLYQWGWHQVQ